MRRECKPKNIVEVKLSYLLSKRRLQYDASIHDTLEIIDDCEDLKTDDLSVLNEYCIRHKIKKLKLSDFSLYHHKKFLESFNCNNVNVFTLIKDASITKIYTDYDPNKEKIINKVNDENITRILRNDRYKIPGHGPNETFAYYNEFLSNENFLDAIDKLAYEISNYAKTDVEKVVLLNKIIKENLIFDFECERETKKWMEDNSYIQKDSFTTHNNENLHIGHTLQSIFIRKKAVCSAIATFCSIVLNHPLLNVKTKLSEDDRIIKDHIWNNIKIGNSWFTSDFSWTIRFNDKDVLKYLLIKARCKNNDDEDNSCKYSNYDYNRREMLMAEEKFKDVHITIPKLPMIGKNLILNSSTLSTRRPLRNR